MRRGLSRSLKMAVLAIAAIFAGASAATAHAGHYHRHSVAHRARLHQIRHGRIGYLAPGASFRGRGYRELVGDPGSGLGFHPLPYRYRVGAWRYHMRGYGTPPWIRNGVLYAMVMDRYRYNYWWATPAESWRYGVFDPYEGVGTPYFAGFYGPAGDEDEPAFPFGRAYGPR